MVVDVFDHGPFAEIDIGETTEGFKIFRNMMFILFMVLNIWPD